MKKFVLKYISGLLLLLAVACDRNVEAPEGMVYIKGGKAIIGSNTGLPVEAPEFKTRIKSFFIDASPVTVGEFRKFIEATGYKTYADNFGDAAVYDFENLKWDLLKGANWEYPLGPDAAPAKDDHPVTQVSWFDANAYAEWAGKRLPTEFEWEYAARMGIAKDQRYTWGYELMEENEFRANVWQGSFPELNLGLDGFLFTSPVGYYGENHIGLTDMGGNVWEWCYNTHEPYKGSKASFPVVEENKAVRGGSFMCDSSYCHGYRVTHRNFTTSETSLFHTGFRCVADIR
jgi:formylglycine-generating enzyme